MPRVTDPPPPDIAAELAELQRVLDENIPAKALDRNLLIATWNIRGFGNLTEKWVSGPNDSPKRDLHAVRCIAEIISRFDVIAIQEVKGNLKALRSTLSALGPDWGLILTDVTKGSLGNQERKAFLFDTRKVTLSGLACELVIPEEQIAASDPDTLTRQFARTPYAVGFRTLGTTFTLVSLHIIWGDSEAERVRELRAIAQWLEDWSRDRHAWDRNLIALGDFNISDEDSQSYRAFTSTGLRIPDDLRGVRRSIFGQASEAKFYDQIAWFGDEAGQRRLALEYVRGGNFDFVGVTLQSRNLSKNSLSWLMSDHLPLWVEFSVRE
jgi:endonuclease/exonuclease/phosphatase family metal-dependent hydrolase